MDLRIPKAPKKDRQGNKNRGSRDQDWKNFIGDGSRWDLVSGAGTGRGLDILMEYLPGNENLQEEADWVVNRLVEGDVKTLAPYREVRSEVVETDEFGTAEQFPTCQYPLRYSV